MKKFIVVGTQRTGSSALAEAIGTHPNVGCGWEWTGKMGPMEIPKVSVASLFEQNFEFLDDKNRRYAEQLMKKELTCLGYRRLFRSTSKWLVKPSLSPVHFIERLGWHLEWIIRNQISVVHIVRADNLGWLKSKAVTKKTGNYSGGKYEQGVSAHIDIDEAVKRIKSKHWIDDRISELEGSSPYIRVVYEDFRENNRTEAQRVLDFLDEDSNLLPELEREMKLKPQSIASDKEMLTNYSELEIRLKELGLINYPVGRSG